MPSLCSQAAHGPTLHSQQWLSDRICGLGGFEKTTSWAHPQRFTVNWSEVGPRQPCFFKSPPADSNAPLEQRSTRLVETLDIHQKTEWDIFTTGAHTVITNIYWVSFCVRPAPCQVYVNIFNCPQNPGGSDGKESSCNAGDPDSIPGSGTFPWRRKWLPTPVFLPGEFHGQRSLAGYSP